MAVKAQLPFKTINFIYISNTNMNKKNTPGLFICVNGATERSFRERELLEFEEDEENSTPIDNDDDDNYDNTHLFCEEDNEEDYDLY